MRAMLKLFAVAALSATTALGQDVDIHGFISQGWVKGTAENNFLVSNSGKGGGSFNFNEFGVNFSKEVMPNLRLGLQLFAQDRGSYGKDKVTLDWGFADYRMKNWFGVRAGKIKNPVGLYGDTRDTDSVRTFVLMPQPMYPDAQRDTLIALKGLGAYGNVKMGAAGEFAYQVQGGAVVIDPVDGTGQRIASAFAVLLPGAPTVTMAQITTDTAMVYSFEWRPPVQGLRLQTSGFQTTIYGKASSNSPVPTLQNFALELRSYDRTVYSIEQTLGNLILAGEFDKIEFDQIVLGKTTPQKSESWYGSATYRFTDWFELGAYHAVRYNDVNDKDGSTYHAANPTFPSHNRFHKDTAICLRFDPVKHTVLKVEYHAIDGSGMLDASEFKTAKDTSYLLAVKVSVSF